MKKLINDPEDVVVEALAGLAAAHADLVAVDASQHVFGHDKARHPRHSSTAHATSLIEVITCRGRAAVFIAGPIRAPAHAPGAHAVLHRAPTHAQDCGGSAW